MKIKDHKGHLESKTLNIPICDKKGCEFFGKQKVEGVCFCLEPFVPYMRTFKYIEQLQQGALDYVAEAQKLYKKYPVKDYVSYLESQATSHWIQQIVALDEVVMLRRQNALLKLEVDKLKNGKTSKTKARTK